MPTYDYRCEACEHQFETFQSITAAPIRKCPKCRKAKVRRLIGTGAAVLFKGDGFYITDYRSEGYKKAQQAESGGGSAGGGEAKSGEAAKTGGDAKSTDAKPATAATAEPKPKAEPKTPSPKPRKK